MSCGRLPILLILWVCGCFGVQPSFAQEGASAMETCVPKLSDEVLFNPGMGLYLQYPPLDARPDEWFMTIANIAYYRLDWSEVNPEKGVYRFEEYFGPLFDFWVRQHGMRVAFRVMCQCMHSRTRYVTPKWVFDQGVPGVIHHNLYGEEQVDPVFWDDRYLELQSEFVARLGQYLDGREGLEFVDIGSIGEWGEMHLARWTREQLEATGYSEARYIQAYRRIIDAHRRAFPRTRVFLNVGGQDRLTINDYAAIHGIHFRQDGLLPGGASYDVGEWLYGPYSRRGTQCNFEFCFSYGEMQQRGLDVAATIEKGLQAPISYLNTNLFAGSGYRRAPEQVRELLKEAARRVGYRFVVTQLQHLPRIRVDPALGGQVPLISTWRNQGVAPCYQSAALEWFLLDAEGQAVATELVFPRTPTTRWWPGEEHRVAALLHVPPELTPGTYTLAVRMVVPESGQHILLGIAGRDQQNRYALCSLPANTEASPSGVVWSQDFERSQEGWGVALGMTATVDEGAAHGGRRSLLLSGSCQQVWNYAGLRLPVPAQMWATYRLSGWMLVEELEPDQHPPFLKIGVNGADGRWLRNYNTQAYDMRKLGTWQRLEVVADLPPEAATLDVAVERGVYEGTIRARLRLDDLELELLRAP